MSSDLTPKIGIIFDLDGTLLDSTGLIGEIPRLLASQYEVSINKSTELIIKEKITTALKGNSGKFLIVRLTLYTAKKYGVPWYLRLKYLKDAGKLYKELIKQTKLFPGTKEALTFLHENNIPYAINTTSSSNEVLDRFEERMDVLDTFGENIITRSDIKQMKPHPESIFKLSEKMNLPPKKMVMVGDMDADIEAGKNAGCITVGVLSGYATREMMEEYNPDFIIESVKDIPNLLPKLLGKIDSK